MLQNLYNEAKENGQLLYLKKIELHLILHLTTQTSQREVFFVYTKKQEQHSVYRPCSPIEMEHVDVLSR